MATVPASSRSTTITLAHAAAGSFLVGFRLFESDSIAAIVDGDERTDFTVSADFSAGYDDAAEITFDEELAAGSVIEILGNLTPRRDADYLNSDPGLTRHLNTELGRMAAVQQELRRDALRSLRGAVDVPPFAPTETGAAVLWDGEKFVTGPTADDIALAQSCAERAEAAAALLDGSLGLIRDGGYTVYGQTDYSFVVAPVDNNQINLVVGGLEQEMGIGFLPITMDDGSAGFRLTEPPIGGLRYSYKLTAIVAPSEVNPFSNVLNASDLGGLQGGLDWLSETTGRKLQITAGTHTITETLTLDLPHLANSEIEAVGGKALIYVNANVHGMQIAGPFSETKLLTADYVPGETTLYVQDLGFTPQAGDVVQIVSDAVDGANRDRGSVSLQYRTGERVVLGIGCTSTSLVLNRPLRFIRGVDPASVDMLITTTGAVTVTAGETLTQATSGATGVVLEAVTAGTTLRLTTVSGEFDTTNLLTGSVSGALGAASVPVTLDESRDESVIDSYTTDMTARVVVMRRAKLRISNIEFAYPDGQSTAWNKTSLRVTALTDFEYDGFAVGRGYGPGLQLRGTHRPRILLPRIERLTNSTGTGQFGYGISLRSDEAFIFGGQFTDCRHGVTSGGERVAAGEMDAEALLGVGRTVGAKVVDCIGRNFGTASAPFDTHHDATEWEFTNCRAIDCANWAFTIRGQGHRLVNPAAINCAKGIFAYTELNSEDDVYDDGFTSRKTAEAFTSCEIINPSIDCATEALRFSHASVTLRGSRVRQAAHQFLRWCGDITLDGFHDWKVTDFDGALDITTQNSLGMIEGTTRNSRAAVVFPVSTLCIAKGAHVVMDGTGGLGTARLSKVDNTAQMVNHGRIDAVCPASVARILSTTGVYSGEGEIRYSIAGGAAGDSVPVDAVGRNISVFAADHSVSQRHAGPFDAFVTPQQFGAVGDGVTDDTAAVQAAIDYCEANGTVTGFGARELYWPAGTYRTGNLTVTKPTKWIGAGSNATQIKCIALTTGDHILIEPTHDGTDYVTSGGTFARIEISGIQFSGHSKADAGGANGIAFRRAGANNLYTEVVMTDCKVWSYPNHGVIGQTFDGLVKWNGCQIQNNNVDGFNINSCYDWRWNGGEIGVNGRDNILFSGCVEMRGFGTYVYAAGRRNFYMFNSGGSWHGGACDTAQERGVYYDNRTAGTGFSFIETSFRYNSVGAANTYADVYVTSLANSELILIAPTFSEPNAGKALKNIEIDGAATVQVIAPLFLGGSGIYDADFADPATQVRHGTGAINTINDRVISDLRVKVKNATQYAGVELTHTDGTAVAKLSGDNASAKGGALRLFNTSGTETVIIPAISTAVTCLPLFGGPYADDAAAAAAGVPIYGLYRTTGGGVQWRQV